MRPIYLMPKAGQIISTIIPSRWSYEANLLHEAAAPEWGPKKVLPDTKDGCAPEPPKAPSVSRPRGAAKLPPAAPLPGVGNLPSAGPLPGSDCPANDNSVLCGDAAENSIPNYTITFNDDSGKEQTCRASANQGHPEENPTVHAVGYRHRFRDSMSVLAGMFALLVSAVLVILRKRDNDPQ